jgi:hypothetical protein
MSRISWLSILIGAFGVMAVPGIARSEERDPLAMKPLLTLYGRNSKITKHKLLRITSADEWQSLWLEHKTGSAKRANVPWDLDVAELDFEKVMVVAVFVGEGAASLGVTSHSMSEVDGRILIRLDENSYQTGVAAGMRAFTSVRGWGILVLPRTNKELVLERDVRTLIADPPKWSEWARFPAILDKKR